MNIAYIRVSSKDQNEARQVESLKNYNIDKWFSEKVSAKNMDREKLQEMLEYVREGDCIFVHDFSRLARSTKDLLSIIELLEHKNVRLVSNKENLDTHTATGRLMLTLIAAINEFERQNLLDRQFEGIQIAKGRGVYKGGQKKKINEKLFQELVVQYKRREITKREMACRLHISRPTLDRLLNEMPK